MERPDILFGFVLPFVFGYLRLLGNNYSCFHILYVYVHWLSVHGTKRIYVEFKFLMSCGMIYCYVDIMCFYLADNALFTIRSYVFFFEDKRVVVGN